MHESVPQRMTAETAADSASAEGDFRAAPRVAVLIRAAKLISDQGEFLCVIRDASGTGISVRLFHPLPQMDGVTLEIPNGDKHRLETVWCDDDKAGFRFVDEVDFERLIANKGEFSKRAMRVNVHMDARIKHLGGKIDVEILNISQQGAQIATPERLALDQRVRLEGPGLPEIVAKVRWRRAGSYGLAFENIFQLAEMACIVANVQLAAGKA